MRTTPSLGFASILIEVLLQSVFRLATCCSTTSHDMSMVVRVQPTVREILPPLNLRTMGRSAACTARYSRKAAVISFSRSVGSTGTSTIA